MNWEETIKFIRAKPEYKDLVEKAYFDEDLSLNVERFRSSEEYKETKTLLRNYLPSAQTILDIGSGNGISAIAFALDSYNVTVSEPDPSDTIGAGAIRKLKDYYGITNLAIHEEFAERINFTSESFDVVYVRQVMHHAYDLKEFIKNLSRLIKPGGLLLTVRDHVIYNDHDKTWFLESHPLQKFYGGENAFTEVEYKEAMEQSGLNIIKRLKHFDSVINYFPLSVKEYNESFIKKEAQIKEHLIKKIGLIGKLPFVLSMYKKKIGFNRNTIFDEKNIPGRMYSFIAQKK